MIEWRAFDILYRHKIFGGERFRFQIGDDVHEYRVCLPMASQMESLSVIADTVSKRSPMKYRAQAIVSPLCGSGLRITAVPSNATGDWLDVEAGTLTVNIVYPEQEHEGPRRAHDRGGILKRKIA